MCDGSAPCWTMHHVPVLTGTQLWWDPQSPCRVGATVRTWATSGAQGVRGGRCFGPRQNHVSYTSFEFLSSVSFLVVVVYCIHDLLLNNQKLVVVIVTLGVMKRMHAYF